MHCSRTRPRSRAKPRARRPIRSASTSPFAGKGGVMQFFTVFIFFFLVLFRGAAHTADVTLPPVFVTATRTETPLEQVTTSASVITADEIQSRKAERVVDALRTVPG